MKSEAASSTMPMTRWGGAPDASHVTPVKHQPLPEPWTPTANLKMLISVASPDIREREKKKVLFTLRENDGDTVTSAEVEEPSQVFERFSLDNLKVWPMPLRWRIWYHPA